MPDPDTHIRNAPNYRGAYLTLLYVDGDKPKVEMKVNGEVLEVVEAVVGGEYHKAIMLMVNSAGPFLTREELEERLDEDSPCLTCGGRGGYIFCQTEIDGSKTYGSCRTCKGGKA